MALPLRRPRGRYPVGAAREGTPDAPSAGRLVHSVQRPVAGLEGSDVGQRGVGDLTEASAVKNPWCPVISTFGKVRNRENTSRKPRGPRGPRRTDPPLLVAVEGEMAALPLFSPTGSTANVERAGAVVGRGWSRPRPHQAPRRLVWALAVGVLVPPWRVRLAGEWSPRPSSSAAQPMSQLGGLLSAVDGGDVAQVVNDRVAIAPAGAGGERPPVLALQLAEVRGLSEEATGQ